MAPSPPRLRILSGAFRLGRELSCSYQISFPPSPNSISPFLSTSICPIYRCTFLVFSVGSWSLDASLLKSRGSLSFTCHILMAKCGNTNFLVVGGNAISAFLSWRLQATNACDVTLVWKSSFDAISQFGVTFKYANNSTCFLALRHSFCGNRVNPTFRTNFIFFSTFRSKTFGNERFKPFQGM